MRKYLLRFWYFLIVNVFVCWIETGKWEFNKTSKLCENGSNKKPTYAKRTTVLRVFV